MTKVALTGLIGAGKSTASEIFKSLGIECYNSDVRAKLLMKSTLRPDIENLLGKDSYNSDGELNKKYIASLIFADETLRNSINSIVHPAVKADFLKWSENQSSPYVIIETAILIESGIDKIVDKIIVVTAEEEERIQRTIKRDNSNEKDVRARIISQVSESGILESADFIVDNSECTLMIPQILEINKIILSLC